MAIFQVFTLQNSNGCQVRFTNYGGKVMSVIVPDKKGQSGDIVLGYSTPEEYAHGNPYFGALIGRYANRIAFGKFMLGNREYQLPVNNRTNCLHGGPHGFHAVFWQVEQINPREAILRYTSPDGEEGFPGELTCEVKYRLSEQNELTFAYRATTNRETVVSLTHHGFFNLRGVGDVLQHELTLHADHYCPVNENLIPLGFLEPVRDSPFDFLTSNTIGGRISQPHQQLVMGNGYDHCWSLNKPSAGVLTLAATIVEPTSGRTLDLWTTEPALQFYSGNFLDGSDVGREGRPYHFRSAFCLEAQHFPDSPNHPHLPSTVLKPGGIYQQTTVYKFGVI